MMKKRVCSLILIFVLCFSISAHALDLDSQGAISMNFETGEVYFEKNADKLMTPASLTKIMTLYVLFEKMETGEITEDTLIPISKNAANLSRVSDATNIPLTQGKYISVRELIDAMTIVSACACCTVVAEYISGSEAAFAALMTETAKSLGINAKFYDASGLSNDNVITPRGIATLVRAFVQEHPEIINYTSKTSVVLNGKTYTSTNQLLPLKNTAYFYSGVDGFKTGTTSKAGKCLASTAVKADARVICVVMKASTNEYRYKDSQKLLDDAFARVAEAMNYLYTTDIKAYINGNQIPCLYKMSDTAGIMIAVDHLNSFGFDTTFDESTQTIYIIENKGKEILPIECEDTGAGEIAKKTEKTPVKAILIKDGAETELSSIVASGNEYLIGFDELSAHFIKTWDGENRIAHMGTRLLKRR